MTVSDTHADTIRKALKYEPDDAAYSESSPWHPDRIRENALAALAAFVSEIERERARADRAEAALREIERLPGYTVSAPAYERTAATTSTVWDAVAIARAALSAGSGGRETT